MPAADPWKRFEGMPQKDVEEAFKKMSKAEILAMGITEAQMSNALSGAVYTRLFTSMLYCQDGGHEGGNIFDTPNILSMADQLGVKMPFLDQPVSLGGPGLGGGCAPYAGPSGVPAQQAASPSAPRAAPAPRPPAPVATRPKQRSSAPAKPAVTRPMDALDGLDEGVPEDVHESMLGAFKAGDVAHTTLAERRLYMKSRPTFYGPRDLKEFVQYGYLHPKAGAPSGMKWMQVTAGWRLKGDVPASLVRMLAVQGAVKDEE